MNKATNSKKASTAEQVESNEVTIPSDMIAEASALCKEAGKLMHRTALFGGRVMEAGFAFRQVMAEGGKAAGMNRSMIESLVSNASPFIAPARLVARGEMSEKAFAKIGQKEARAAFKQAGGAKGDGFDPTAWRSAFDNPAEKIPAPAPAPSGGQVTAHLVFLALIESRGKELNAEEARDISDRLLTLHK